MPAAPPTPPTPSPADPVAELVQLDETARLRAALTRIAKGLRPVSTPEGLSPAAIDLLGTTVRRGPTGLSELARVEGLNPTMLSRLAAKLEEQGLVRRLTGLGDGRAAALEATDKGRALRDRVLAERSNVLNRALAPLPQAERALIISALPALEALAEALRR